MEEYLQLPVIEKFDHIFVDMMNDWSQLFKSQCWEEQGLR